MNSGLWLQCAELGMNCGLWFHYEWELAAEGGVAAPSWDGSCLVDAGGWIACFLHRTAARKHIVLEACK